MRRTRSATPCIGICSTTFGDDVCKGCRRFSHEIISWPKYSDDERAIVNSRIEQFKIKVLQEKFSIIDPDVFHSKLSEHSIKFNDSMEPITWLFDLLRASGKQELNLEDFGVQVLPKYAHYPLPDLNQLMNTEFSELSEAYFNRIHNLSI